MTIGVVDWHPFIPFDISIQLQRRNSELKLLTPSSPVQAILLHGEPLSLRKYQDECHDIEDCESLI